MVFGEVLSEVLDDCIVYVEILNNDDSSEQVRGVGFCK
jgi:hypothetical protein